MEREKQLQYCKKCIHKKFNAELGIICGLTQQLPSFEDICVDFTIDKAKLEAEKESKTQKQKSKWSFGFSPRQTDSIDVADLTRKQAYVLAYEAAMKLKWNAGYVSESGFLAYTGFSMSSYGEEVQVKIQVGYIEIKSELTGSQVIDWGKNRKNIDRFIATLHQLKAEPSLSDFEEKYDDLSKNFVPETDDLISHPLSRKEKVSGVFSLFMPGKNYFFTPVLILLNVLVFVLMAISGVNIFQPTIEDLILWGANFRPLTLEAEPWRLVSCVFIHIGVFHLLMNMYALLYIGLMLEPLLGRARFISAYMLTGLAASVTSLFWHEMTVSAGASGAIFGLYGVFFALLTTRVIEKAARKSLLISIGIFIVYNLMNGLKDGIDNAAHIGGLVSGLIAGYLFVPGLIKPESRRKLLSIGMLTVLVSLATVIFMRNTTSDLLKYDEDMESFMKLEEQALEVYNLPESASTMEILEALGSHGLRNWEACLTLLDQVDTYDLPEDLHARNKRLREYCELRIKSYSLIQKAVMESSNKYDFEIYRLNLEVEKIINELTQAGP